MKNHLKSVHRRKFDEITKVDVSCMSIEQGIENMQTAFTKATENASVFREKFLGYALGKNVSLNFFSPGLWVQELCS